MLLPVLRRGLTCTLLLGPGFVYTLLGAGEVAQPDTQATTSRRLIVVKVDGLPGRLMEAAFDPSGTAADALPYSRQFREAHASLRSILDRDVLLPNLTHYFLHSGARVDTIYSSTLPLSAPSWALIDTGQPSIVKRNYYFDRSAGLLRGFLDGPRDTSAMLAKNIRKTNALWELDLAGVPLISDAFEDPDKWNSMQILYRKRPAEQMANLGQFLVKAGRRDFKTTEVLLQHLRHNVAHPTYYEWNDENLARTAAERITLMDPENPDDIYEKFEFISVLFVSLDHRLHVDPDYQGLLNWLVKTDRWFGEIMAAVEASLSRDRTVVAVVSDHGSDFDPSRTNYGLPISFWLRKKEFGGHTVLTPHAEDVQHAVTVPVPGIDFPRVYESSFSPYNSYPHGEKGYFTAFAANGGNPRFDMYLRNSDLNELHLLLLELRRLQEQPRMLEWAAGALVSTLERSRPWMSDLKDDLETAVKRALRLIQGSLPPGV